MCKKDESEGYFMKNKPKALIYTLGCRVNTCESLSLADRLKECGFEIASPKSTATPDAVIVNTCAVTAEGSRKCAQAVRRYRQKYPDALIVAAGCLCQSGRQIPEADIVFGNADKDAIAPLVKKHVFERPTAQINAVTDILSEKRCSDAIHKTPYMTKCHIKIEDGCDSRCSYCIIPSLRGRVRSKAPDELIREIRERVSEGMCEIVLTGIETGSYGKDLGGVCLCDILEEADKTEGIYLIRLGSLDPYCFTDEFIERLSKLKHLEKHIHLSVQSGADNVLSGMKRKYNRKMLTERINKLYERIPGLYLTADIITGFPGETEEDFEQTLLLAKEVQFFHIHIFPYSEREGTVAATMENSVPPEIRKRRAAELEKVNSECKKILLEKAIGSECEIHFETKKGDCNRGYNSAFVPVAVKCAENLKGMIRKVRITEVLDGEMLAGELI